MGNVKATNWGAFTIISGKVFGINEKSRNCFVLGLFNTWTPFCINFTLPQCEDIGGCQGRGLCVASNFCLCLPGSKSDERCSANIMGFERFKFFGFLPEGIPNFSILEAVMFLVIAAFALCLINRSPSYTFSSTTWSTSILGLKVFQLLIAPFVHESFLQMTYNLYSFYCYAPAIYSLTREPLFIKLFLASSIFGFFVGCIFNGLLGTPFRASGLSPFLCCAKTFFLLASSTSRGLIVQDLIRMAFSHVVLDFMFLGSKFNPAASMSGLLSGYTFYRYIFLL